MSTHVKHISNDASMASIRIYPNLPGSSKRSEGESFVSWFSSCSNESSEKMSTHWNRLWNRLKRKFSTSPTQTAHIVANTCKYGVSWSWMICIDSSCIFTYADMQTYDILWYPTLRILSVHIRHVQCHALRPVTFIHFIHVIHSLFIWFILFMSRVVPWRLLAHAAVFLLCL